MIETAFTRLFGITHPVALAGMSGATSPELVAAVSNAGGLGILALTRSSPDKVRSLVAAVREKTARPFGINLLLTFATDEEIRVAAGEGPTALSTAWPRDEQDLRSIFDLTHAEGVKVIHMVPSVADAEKAAEAGADVIVAQGTDGGGHIGLMGTVVIVPAVAKAVAPVPVLAAGGIADGRGLAAMLALGAAGVLMGTRFLATTEVPLPEPFKRHIVASDGTDTIVTDVGDVMLGNDWPGAYARIARNRIVERWLGRPSDLRRAREEVLAAMDAARRRGDVDEAIHYYGQSAALIDDVASAGDVVTRTVTEAEAILRSELPKLLSDQTS